MNTDRIKEIQIETAYPNAMVTIDCTVIAHSGSGEPVTERYNLVDVESVV